MTEPQSANPTPFDLRHFATMTALVCAGEAVFGLPFVLARVFRPTLLDVLDITHLELGTAFSIYGIVAMLAYFPGGALADRFSARKMMATALWVTALGGAYYAALPSLEGLRWLFGFWGVSTILLFWAAMIRATRGWGGPDAQGRAFGLLDGGRGLFAAMLATFTVAVFAALLPEDPATASLAERKVALQQVIWIFTAMTAFAGGLVWFLIPDDELPTETAPARATLSGVLTVVQNPAIWLQGLIVITAYTGYKSIDDLSLLARDVYGFDDVAAAGVTTLAFWVRPFAAVGAGLLGDRLGGVRTLAACFAVLIVGDAAIAFGLLNTSPVWVLSVLVVSICACVYGLRGLYFAVLREAGAPMALTGTAVGLVSVVGYTPDIFMGPLNGYLTDTYPGTAGHEMFFGVLTGFAGIGLLACAGLAALSRK